MLGEIVSVDLHHIYDILSQVEEMPALVLFQDLDYQRSLLGPT